MFSGDASGCISWMLDRKLADGCAPEGSAALTRRAQELCGHEMRVRLASSLRRVVADPERKYAMNGSTAPGWRQAVLPWREGILGLADRLERPSPLNTCGVARVAVLLADDTGPLHNPATQRSVGEAIWWVADGLQLCPPHAWNCPVIMKLDPEHVAWTCGRCGLIAKTDGLSSRPA